ncbi:hypothetical protein [Streptomyces sp. NPDC059611]|uniref:hypothetical protein n=1 Tax=Streptomyces sp. NPDC059611 TaxID=3346884 RepID=UPI0036AB5C10
MDSAKASGSTRRPVLDPDAQLSGATWKILRQSLEAPRRYTGSPGSAVWAAVPFLARGGAVVVAAAGVWWWLGGLKIVHSARDGSTMVGAVEQQLQGTVDLVHALLSLWPMAGGGVALICAGLITDQARHNRRLRRLADAERHLVRPQDLTPDAQVLLARAQRAVTAVLGSAVHREKWLDAQRNEVSLPRQEWLVARDLREYSRVARTDQKRPLEADSVIVAELVASRRRALARALRGIERRVAALEAYAERVAEADARYTEVRKTERLSAGNDELLDLLALTPADDLAVAEIEALTDDSVAVTSTFTRALASAEESSILFRPGQGAAQGRGRTGSRSCP